MRDVKRPAPTGDLDTADEIGDMVRRFHADVAHNVARVHSHQLLGQAVSFDPSASR